MKMHKPHSSSMSLAAAAAAIALLPLPSRGQSCQDGTCGFLPCRAPAYGAPAALWGALEPTDAGQLPPDRDNTDFNEFFDPYGVTEPHWSSLDVENGYVFATAGHAWQIWDARSNPAQPSRIVNVNTPAQLPEWVWGEEKLPLRDIDAPAGRDDLVAIAAVNSIGVSLWDTTVKAAPRPLYQDYDQGGSKQAYEVYTAVLGGNPYAFAATTGVARGLVAYDMGVASTFSTPCVESSPGAMNPACAGVYLGQIGSRSDVRYVDGAGDFVVLASGSQRGFEIWNVSNPRAPQMVLTDLNDPATGGFVHGVALWKGRGGSGYFLALQIVSGTTAERRVYDVSCIGSGSCGALGVPTWAGALSGGLSEYYTTWSRGRVKDVVYFGSVDSCSGGLQREYLVDVTDPYAAGDATPAPVVLPGDSAPTGYWGWYYRGNLTGFNRVTPRVGKLAGDFFYRAAYSLFDIHRLAAPDVIAGKGLGNPNENRVKIADASGQPTATDFLAYAAGHWGVNVASGSIAGGNRARILTGPGPGDTLGPQVRAFAGGGSSLAKVNFFAYGTLRYGVNVASGTFDGDAYDEILTGAGPGAIFGPHVRGFQFDNLAIAAVAKLSFFAYGTLKNGVDVTMGGVDADGNEEIVTGPGPGVAFAAQVRGFAFDGAVSAIAKINFDAYPSLRYGVNVAASSVDADAYAEIAAAPGPGPTSAYASRFLGFDYDATSIAPIPGFDVTPYATLFGGRVGLADLGFDGASELLAGAGRDAAASATVHAYGYRAGALTPALSPFAPFAGGYGINVAGAILGV
ncbi:MAG: hypothetical protein U0166_21005 [Acidobacteriota bacterium]